MIRSMHSAFTASAALSARFSPVLFFSNQIFGGDATVGTQLFTQVKDALTTVVYSGVATFVILKVVSAICGGLRVEKDVEREGLDLNVHGERVE